MACGEIAGRVRLVKSAQPPADSSSSALAALAELDAAVRPDGQAAPVVDTFFGVASRPVAADRVDSVVLEDDLYSGVEGNYPLGHYHVLAY